MRTRVITHRQTLQSCRRVPVLVALSGALWRKKRLIIALTLAAAAVAFVVVNMMTPRYRSEARVLIETRDNIFVRPEAEKTLDKNLPRPTR